MDLQRAIEIMKSSTTVEEWNQNREFIKSQVSNQEWFSTYFTPIDASGLIVEVLNHYLNQATDVDLEK